jgi:hypothetical protein
MSKYFTKLKTTEIKNISKFNPSSIDNCVGLYNFDDITNLSLDSSGLGRNGTSNITSSLNISDGIRNRELVGNFTGGNKSIILDAYASNFNYNTFSISYWFKIPTLGDKTVTLCIDDGTTDNYFQITSLVNALGFTLKIEGSTIIDCYTESTYTDNNWHHVVIIIGLTGNKMYIDNVLKTLTYSAGTSATTTSLNGFSASRITIGKAPSGFVSFNDFTGYLDNFTFYNKNLNINEIDLLYNESETSISSIQNNKIVNKSGTAVNPSYTFENDENLGIYRVLEDSLGFTTNGIKRMNIDTTNINFYLPLISNNSIYINSGKLYLDDGFQLSTGASDGYILVSDSIGNASWRASSFTGFLNGSISEPSIYFTGDPDTGIYWGGENIIGFSTGGNLRMSISDTLISTPGSMAVGTAGSTFQIRAPIGTVSAPGISFNNPTNAGLSFGASNLNLVHSSGVRLALNGSNAVYGVRQQNVDGTDLLPSITFTLDPDTGIYRIGDNNIGISTGGVKRLDINSADIEASLPLIVPDGSATNPGLGFATAKNYGLFYSGTVISMAFNGAQRFTFDQNRLRGPNGTTAAPSYSFTGDTDTGMFWNGANILGFSTGAANRMNISNNEISPTVPIRSINGSATAPTYSFTGDPDTGIYWGGANTIDLSTDGTLRMSISDTAIDLSHTSATFKTSTGPNYYNGLKYNGKNNTLSSNTTLTTTGTNYSFIPLSSNSDFEVILPTTTNNDGLEYIFINTGVGKVTIKTNSISTEYFDANSSYSSLEMNQYDKLRIICYNGNWFTF